MRVTGLRLFGESPAAKLGRGGPLAATGFRPFFLLAGAFAAGILPIWLLALAGIVRPDAYLDATYWHAHEMVFGFAAAVLAAMGRSTSKQIQGLPRTTETAKRVPSALKGNEEDR